MIEEVGMLKNYQEWQKSKIDTFCSKLAALVESCGNTYYFCKNLDPATFSEISETVKTNGESCFKVTNKFPDIVKEIDSRKEDIERKVDDLKEAFEDIKKSGEGDPL